MWLKFAHAQAHAVLLLTLPTGLGPPTVQPLHPPLVGATNFTEWTETRLMGIVDLHL